MPESPRKGRLAEAWRSFGRAALFLVISIVLIASSVYFGKESLASDIPYDLGIAFLTVALVELGIRKIIKEISASWEQLVSEETSRRERERVALESQAAHLKQIAKEIRMLSERTRSAADE